jgi:glycosyltransferase involved in cell wall biosynthesis
MNGPDLSIVLPCYNERQNIALLIKEFDKFWPSYEFELILVDNGSTDGTDQEIKSLLSEKPHPYIKVVTVPRNIGYGHGILSGLKAATAPILAYTHADIQTPPEDVFRAFQIYKEAIEQQGAALVKGRRLNREESAVFLTKAMTRVVQLVLGHHLEDINGQPKLFPRDLLDKMSHPPTDFAFDIYVMYLATLSRWQILEFPVEFRDRVYGQSKWDSNVFSRYKTIFRYLVSILLIASGHLGAPRNLLGQAGKFGITGVVTNLANYGTFIALLNLANVQYAISSILGFLAGFILGFVVNRSWTFSKSDSRVIRQLARYYVVNLISLGVNVVTIVTFTEVVGLIPQISQVFAIAASATVNFAGSKFWAFRA